MKTKHVVFIALIGALYAVLTLGIAPLSYGPIQFRASEFLKVFCLWNPLTGLGIAIGDILSAMASPYLSAWELVFMPITDIVGGFLAYYIFVALKERFPFVPMTIYALTTALSVAIMLVAFGVDVFWPLFVSVGISELVILNVGIPIGYQIKKIIDIQGLRILSK